MLERVTPGPRLPALVAIALLLRPAVPPDGRALGTVFPVPELSTTIVIDGCPIPPGTFICPNDWPGGTPFLQSSAAPAVTGYMVVSHPKLVLVAGPHVQRDDALYLHLVINDNTNNAGDNVVFMLDVDRDHVGNDPGDKGVQFRRDGTVNMVQGDPNAPGSSGITTFGPSSCTAALSRVCIKPTIGASTSQWIVEAKLKPEDFGGVVFAGQLAGMLIAKDLGPAGTVSSWPPTSSHNDPTTWAELKLGNPVDVMLVLDLSGSMQSPVCSVICQPKITVLKQAVQDFINLFKEVAVPADRLGVRYFKTNVTQFPTGADLQPVLDYVATDVTSSANASGFTAMGGGLQSAINVLTNTDQERSIVLFTDGMQNVNPMVDENTLLIQDVGSVSLPSGVSCVPTPTVVSCPTDLDASPIRRVNTVAVAAATDKYTTLLSKIATNTGAEAKMTAAPDDDLRKFFVEALINALRKHSPQLIAYRQGRVTGDSARETFTTNHTVKKIILALTWNQGDSLTFRVERDGVDVTGAGSMTASQFSRIWALPLPARFEGNDITPGGDWHMRVTGRDGTAYHAAAIADETLLEYDLAVGAGDHVAGDTLRWTARLTFGGKPVTDARITAAILRPQLSIGTLLSTNPTPSLPDSLQIAPDATAAQHKLQLLLQNQQHWKSIQPTEHSVTLQSHGDGTYSATLLNTKIVGPYTARFEIEGERTDIGTYRRTENVSTMVRFGRAEFRRSAVRVTLVSQTPTERRWLLYLRPQDRFANDLGPEYLDEIGVSLASGTVGADRRDLVDGGYTVPLTVPSGADPVVTITVLDQPLFMDRLSKLEVPRFGLSLHAGLSLPLGKFNDGFDAGPSVTADATRRLNGTFALAALLGFHHFGGSGPAGDLNIYHLSGSVEALLATGSTGFFVDAGGGGYVLDPGTTHPGVHGGLGVKFEVSPRLELGGSLRAHTVFTSGSNTSFSSIQAGGRILF